MTRYLHLDETLEKTYKIFEYTRLTVKDVSDLTGKTFVTLDQNGFVVSVDGVSVEGQKAEQFQSLGKGE